MRLSRLDEWLKAQSSLHSEAPQPWPSPPFTHPLPHAHIPGGVGTPFCTGRRKRLDRSSCVLAGAYSRSARLARADPVVCQLRGEDGARCASRACMVCEFVFVRVCVWFLFVGVCACACAFVWSVHGRWAATLSCRWLGRLRLDGELQHVRYNMPDGVQHTTWPAAGGRVRLRPDSDHSCGPQAAHTARRRASPALARAPVAV